MNKLLRADIARLFKSKSFWVCAILSFALTAVNLITNGIVDDSWRNNTYMLMMSGNSNILFLVCVFIPLFIGTDYSNGTIRNKLTVGATRLNVYFSNLITAAAGGLLIAAAAWVPNIVGICAGKTFGMGAGQFMFRMLIIVLAIIAMSSIFTLFGMLITSRSANTAVTITGAFVLIIAAAIILNLLSQPEFVSGYEITVDGVSETEPQPNPYYISGARRQILTAVNDILPSGQMIQFESNVVHNEYAMPLYSLGVMTVTTAAGLVLFRKKDLK